MIHFDAHSDTWEDEEDRVDHGTMFYHAVKQGVIDSARSIQVGLRTFNEDSWGFNQLKAPWVHEHGCDAVVDEIRRVGGGYIRRCRVIGITVWLRVMIRHNSAG